MDVSDKKRGRCGAIMSYFHSAASIVHKEAKAKTKGKKKEITTISQKSRTDCRGCLYQGERGRCLSEMRPRTSCLQQRFGADLALPWMESRRTTVHVDQSVPRRSRRLWRVEEHQPYRRWKFSEWFWWPSNTPMTRRWHTGSTSSQRLDGAGASSGGKPSLGTGTVLPEDGGSTGNRWSMDTGTDRIGVWIAQPNTTLESESMNHRQDWCGNTRSNDEVKDEPVLTASHVLKEHQLRKDRKTRFQSSRRRFGSEAFGHAVAHWPCFRLRQKPGLVSSMF